MISKKVFNRKSKTHWFNAAATVTGAAMIYLPGLEGVISPEIFPWVLAGFGIGNHVLRNITTTPIDQK